MGVGWGSLAPGCRCPKLTPAQKRHDRRGCGRALWPRTVCVECGRVLGARANYSLLLLGFLSVLSANFPRNSAFQKIPAECARSSPPSCKPPKVEGVRVGGCFFSIPSPELMDIPRTAKAHAHFPVNAAACQCARRRDFRGLFMGKL